jgi:hypothetical protein
VQVIPHARRRLFGARDGHDMPWHLADPRFTAHDPSWALVGPRPDDPEKSSPFLARAPSGRVARALRQAPPEERKTMLRIDRIERDGRTVFQLEGRVIGAWVDELRRSCRDALGHPGSLTLDLGAVSFVDAGGVVLLRELESRQVALANTTPFVAAQLRG